MKLKYYLRYCPGSKDDSPLYVFDSTFGEHDVKRALLDDYEVGRMRDLILR